MPYKTIEMRNERKSQQLFPEVIKTVPLSPFSTDLSFKVPEAEISKMERITEGKGLEKVKISYEYEGDKSFPVPIFEMMVWQSKFQDLRKIYLPEFLEMGCQITGGELKLIPWMKSSIYLYQHNFDNNFLRGVVLRVAGDTIDKADPKGEILKWFDQLGKKFHVRILG
ncbi:MAG: hypothetical protein Q7R43_01390 [Candidatus Daviesbacteria bacterium]|nr:hypothetical protein [Candidatus Daviesbacteria bacterium]